MNKKTHRLKKRQLRVRGKIRENSNMPRLSVYRSSKYIYAQIFDHSNGNVVVSESDQKYTKGTKSERAAQVGEAIAKKAIAKKISTVVFDRSGYKYHGRVKMLAESARKGGLKF